MRGILSTQGACRGSWPSAQATAMPPAKQVKLPQSSCILCGRTRSSTMPTRRLSSRRQILSTAGRPKLTTPWKTEAGVEGPRETSTHLTSIRHKNAPKEKHLFFYFPAQKTPKNHAWFLSFSSFLVPRIQKTNNQNIILLIVQKTLQVCHQ